MRLPIFAEGKFRLIRYLDVLHFFHLFVRSVSSESRGTMTCALSQPRSKRCPQRP